MTNLKVLILKIEMKTSFDLNLTVYQSRIEEKVIANRQR